MKQLAAFTKKEIIEYIRTGKLWIMLVIFTMFGIMNPAIAKVTPWLYEMLSESMEEQGIIIANVEVNALTSWMQFYKNIFMALLVLSVMFCGILTAEYQKGTLINMLTKGLSRWKVIAAKSVSVIALWSVCYWLCYGITYGYNAYFWDNSIGSHIGLSAACIYLFGIWLISLIMLASSIVENSSAVLMIVGGVLIVAYLISLIPAAAEYSPIQLMSSGNIVSRGAKLSEFRWSAVITAGLSAVGFAGAVLTFNKKKL